MPRCITVRTGWRAFAVSVAPRLYPAVGILALSACSPVRPPSPKEERVERSDSGEAGFAEPAGLASPSPAERAPAPTDRDPIQPGSAGTRFIGKPYDTAFGWSDDRIYCSELVYKVYHEVFGIEVGPIQRLREFDLSSPAVRAKLTERYGESIPLNEPVVSPAGIFDSPTLTTVLER